MNENNQNNNNNSEIQVDDKNGATGQPAGGEAVAGAAPGISEQEHQILLQQLQLNLQEQSQMKLGLQNQEGLQLLYEQNP